MRVRKVAGVLLIALAVVTSGPALASDTVFSGKTVLTKDMRYGFNNIVFDDKSVIVTNGFKLVLEGSNSITFKGAPQIVSYDPAAATGRSGGLVVIRTKELKGTRLKIRDFGEDGPAGAQGPQGPKGAKGQQGEQRKWDWRGCYDGSDGGRGGPGGLGGDGGPGGNGGVGGLVIFEVRKGFLNGGVPRLDIDVSGGQGGTGGGAGPGGAGGDGGDGAPGTFYCGGTGPGGPGPGGPAGRQGLPGVRGSAGTIIDYGENSAPRFLETNPAFMVTP